MSSQERRFKGFNQEEWVVLMEALTSLFRQEIIDFARYATSCATPLERRLEVLRALVGELSEEGFWPREQA